MVVRNYPRDMDHISPPPLPAITKRGLKVVQRTILWTVCDSDSRSPFRRCLMSYRILLKKMRSTTGLQVSLRNRLEDVISILRF